MIHRIMEAMEVVGLVADHYIDEENQEAVVILEKAMDLLQDAKTSIKNHE